MTFPTTNVFETPNGVFLPSSSKIEFTVYGVIIVLLLGAVLTGLLSSFALLQALVLAGLAFYRYRHYRRFGRDGQPLAAVGKGLLVFGFAEGSKNVEHRYPLHLIQRLHVYGPQGRRNYRLEFADGAVELTPQWGRDVEIKVLAFLARAMADRYSEAEPQTMFAQVRGDGAYLDE